MERSKRHSYTFRDRGTLLRFLSEQKPTAADCLVCGARIDWADAANRRVLALLALAGHAGHDVLFERPGRKPVLRQLPPSDEISAPAESNAGDEQIVALVRASAPWLARLGQLIEILTERLNR